MATETRATRDAGTYYRIDLRQFDTMIGARIFADSARVELLGGLLVEKMTRHAPHTYCVLQLARALRDLLPAPWFVAEEKPIELGRYWCPEPDISVVRGPLELYRVRRPGSLDLGILVEVSDSSYNQDRGVKWRRYAAAGLPLFWIINLGKKQVEIYRDPSGRGRSAVYGSLEIHGIDAELPVVIDGVEVGRVAVRDILP